MSEIIPFVPKCRFCVYEHKIQKGKELSVYRMIVLKNERNRIVNFTGLEHYSYPYTGQKPLVKVRAKAELVYICQALNYIFAHNRVSKIADINAEMVFSFFDAYINSPKGASDEIKRSQQSMDLCVRHVSSFFCNLAAEFQTHIHIDDLMVYEDTKANSHSRRVTRRYYPRYTPTRPNSHDALLLRDMPLAAARRLIQLASAHDPMIAFGIALQLYAGLRPSCVMNVRQKDSPLSTVPGIQLSYNGSGISKMQIDLNKEYVLRSDGVKVGGIKKERTVTVYKGFLEFLVPIYKEHLALLAKTPWEEQYKPMFIGRNGKAMTYQVYSRRVKDLLLNKLKPECEKVSELQPFAQLLESAHWGPHTFRHCFTVQLVLKGLDAAQIQMFRGDRSPESALAYMAGKGELMSQARQAHEQAFAALLTLPENNENEVDINDLG